MAGGSQRAVGLSVRLFERDSPGAATSRVAAGMIAPISEASPSEPELLALARESAGLYPEFVAELRHESGLDPGYLRFGTLFVARDADEAAVLERELAFRTELGLPVRRLRASEARALAPALAPTLRLALEIPDDHAIDPRALTAALAAAFEAAGGELCWGADVQELVVDGGRVTGVRLASGSFVGAGAVVVAAGPWSGDIDGLPAEARVSLRPVKGQILELRDPAGPGLLEEVLRMQPGYVVPRGDGRYVLGATVEERSFDTIITAGAVSALLRDAIELVPRIADWELVETCAGIRPGTADNLPILGPSGSVAGLHWATGHYRHGVMLAPVTAERVLAGLGVVAVA